RILEVAGREITPLNMGRIAAVMEEYTQESTPHLGAVTALLDQILEYRELLVLEFEDAISGNLIDYNRRLQRLANLGPEVATAVRSLGFHLEHLLTNSQQLHLV